MNAETLTIYGIINNTNRSPGALPCRQQFDSCGTCGRNCDEFQEVFNNSSYQIFPSLVTAKLKTWSMKGWLRGWKFGVLNV
jgi:hypothetical protein